MFDTMSTILFKTNSFLLKMNRDDYLNWFHGKISREEAEQLLKTEEEDGAFLVRESNTSIGDYVLSILHQGEVVHYQIRRHGEDAFFSIEEQTTVHGLDTLIQHYQEDSSGLVTRLAVFCRGKPPPHNARTHGVRNLLHRAIEAGNRKVVSELLTTRCKNRDAKNHLGQTAVHLSCLKGGNDFLNILSDLIKDGMNVNVRDSAGFAPLHYACQLNLIPTMNLLIEEGNANVQIRHTQTGRVPLHEAAQNGHLDCIKTLLSYNAPANPRASNNETPADLAKENNHMDCYNYLSKFTSPNPKTTKAQWYHGTLSRDEAVQILKEYCKSHSISSTDGAFLVRYSNKHTGTFVLTMLCDNSAYNFIIKKEGEKLFIDDGPYLDSLEHLIEHYSILSDGLPTCLHLPVPPTPKPPLPEFSTMPRSKKTSPNRTPPTQSPFKQSMSLRKGSLPAIPPNQSSQQISQNSIEQLTKNLSFSTDFMNNPSIKSSLMNLNNNSTSPDSKSPSNNNMKRDMLSSPASKHSLLGSNLSLLPNSRDILDEDIYKVPTNNDLVFDVSDLSLNENTPSMEDFIPFSQLTLGAVLGEGEFGSALRGTYSPPNGPSIPIAIKTLHSQHVQTNKEEFLREAKVMMGLDHPCIVRLIGISMTPQLAMVQELAPLGSLVAFLLEHPDQASPMYELKLWACQVACGMKYLEQKRFVHRDLATRNILLMDKHQAKISDFGLSRALSTDSTYYTASQGGKWPIKWYAPESYNYGTFSHKSDVWSFGVTLWEMYSYGQQPYGDKRGAEAIEIVERGERLEKPNDCPERIYSVMRDCWAYDPQDRPTFGQLVEIFSAHPEYMNVSQLVMKTDDVINV